MAYIGYRMRVLMSVAVISNHLEVRRKYNINGCQLWREVEVYCLQRGRRGTLNFEFHNCTTLSSWWQVHHEYLKVRWWFVPMQLHTEEVMSQSCISIQGKYVGLVLLAAQDFRYLTWCHMYIASCHPSISMLQGSFAEVTQVHWVTWSRCYVTS